MQWYGAAMAELLGLIYSPWSEKARWALDARAVPYRFRPYLPLLGEPALRLKLRRWRGRVTVPVLTDDGGRVFADSLDIARWGDGHGDAPALLPAGREREIQRWVDLSEQGLNAGRALALMRVISDDDALLEMVPRPLRRARPAAIAIGRAAIGRTLRKYGGQRAAAAIHARALCDVLDELRAALAVAAGDPPALLGRFSFADVAIAQALAFVQPPAFGLRLGRASRRSFHDPALSARYADLIMWRDAVYEAHRPRA